MKTWVTTKLAGPDYDPEVSVAAVREIIGAHDVVVGSPSCIPVAGKLPHDALTLKLSVGRTCPVHLLEIEGLLTQGSRPGRTSGESVGGIFEMDSSDWSNGIRHHVFDTRPDTEFKLASTREFENPLRSVSV